MIFAPFLFFFLQNCSIDFASYLYHGSHINITYYGKKESTLKINGVHLNPMWQVANFR